MGYNQPMLNSPRGRIRPYLAALLLLATLLHAGCRGEAQPSILFLRGDPAGAAQLYLQPPGDSPARQLTGTNDPAAPPVIDYAVSPDSRNIAYSVDLSGAGGEASALRLIERDGRNDKLILDCPAAECSAPVWSPDGQRLIYERRPWQDGLLGTPRLYWLDPSGGETLPLIEGDETPGYGARFSPDGAWLSYVSLGHEGVVALHLTSGEQRLLTSRVGSPAAFSPDGLAIVYSDISLQAYESGPPAGGAENPLQESANVFLYRSSLNEDSPRQRLSPDVAVVDSVPAFSPDGAWLAFGRAPATAHARQIWLMRPDGTDARSLTGDTTVSNGPPRWSPDGRYLLFQRYRLDDPAGVAAVWRLEIATGRLVVVTDEGYLPEWLPASGR